MASGEYGPGVNGSTLSQQVSKIAAEPAQRGFSSSNPPSLLRSHSTEKQSSAFVSKLEGRVRQNNEHSSTRNAHGAPGPSSVGLKLGAHGKDNDQN